MDKTEAMTRGTLFCRLRQAVRDDINGDDVTLEKKLALIANCEANFGREATQKQVETALQLVRR